MERSLFWIEIMMKFHPRSALPWAAAENAPRICIAMARYGSARAVDAVAWLVVGCSGGTRKTALIQSEQAPSTCAVPLTLAATASRLAQDETRVVPAIF